MEKAKAHKRLLGENNKTLLILIVVLILIFSGGALASLSTDSTPSSSNQSQNGSQGSDTTNQPDSFNVEQGQQSAPTSQAQEPTCNVKEQDVILAELAEQMKNAGAYYFNKLETYTQTQRTADELTFYAKGISTAAYNMASSYRDDANTKLASINCPPAPGVESYNIFTRPSD